MSRTRDPFANFERMRRQIDELFGDAWTRAGLSQRRTGFRPRVDVYYSESGDRPRAVIKADLAGVATEDLSIEVRGRTLVISGERKARDPEGRVYQQIEIESGPFQREIQLGVEVVAAEARATYEDGVLRIEVPLVAARAGSPGPDRRSRDRRERRAGAVIEVVQGGPETLGDPAPIQHLPELLPVLPLREMVAFPNTMTPLAVGQERSVQLVNDALSRDRMLVMVAGKDPEIEEPGPDDVYRVGVAGTIARMLKMPDGTLRILVQGGPRVRIDEFPAREPYLVARIHEEPDVIELSSELEALTRHIQTTFSSIIEGVPYLPEELQVAIANIDDPEALGHMIAGSLRIKTEEKQDLLEERNVTNRLRKLSSILARELEVMELGSKIQSEVQSEMDKTQREYFLREQMKAIQRELGEEDETQAEINELRRQMEEAQLPEDVRKAAERELVAARAAASRRGRVRRDPHLPGVDHLAAVVQVDRGQPRHRHTRAGS